MSPASSSTSSGTPTHLLFDLGGVIVELAGRPLDDVWLANGTPPEDSWKLWLTSDAPRAFETGHTGPAEFARAIVDELDLQVTPEAFLARFLHLPVGTYPGALELLHALKGRYVRGIFSNSNVLHWPRKMGEMHLDDAVDDHFASHLIGHVKPDPGGFEHVVRHWGVAPGRILFLDDNALNVEAARAAGFVAERVVGLDAAKRALEAHGVRW